MAEPTYRIEKVAYAYRVVCTCGWHSKFAPVVQNTLLELERHRRRLHP